jgi:hypothetical protein
VINEITQYKVIKTLALSETSDTKKFRNEFGQIPAASDDQNVPQSPSNLMLI